MEMEKDVLKDKYNDIMDLYRANDILAANDKLQEFLKLASEKGDHYYYATALNFLGVLQIAMGNVQRAIDYYFESMLYAERHHANEMLPVVYNNIGSHYLDVSSYDTALKYLLLAERYANEQQQVSDHVDPKLQKQRKAVNYMNIAVVYTNLQRYEESETYLDKIKELDVEQHRQDTEFACQFIHCQNQFFQGNTKYVEDNIDFLLDGIADLVSLYSYEQNITDMFHFLITYGKKDKLLRLLDTVEVFIEKHPDSHYGMLSAKMRNEYEQRFGTHESYRESCIRLVEMYKVKEKETVHERELYMNLRMEMKRTEEKRNYEEQQQKELLAGALKEAERANRAKSEFLSKMSHEIRTPLNAVIGYIDMAQNHLDNVDKLDSYHKKAQIAAKHLLSLINDILDVSAISSGHFKVEYKTFDLKQIIGDINTMFRQQAINKSVEFFIDMQYLEHEMIIGDAMRVKQILLNLLSNAMKFTPEHGKITLFIEQNVISRKSDQWVQMLFKVQDTGIGMTKEFMEKIFTPFEQQDASISRKYGGTGLGLSISKQLSEMMGGGIHVESTEGVGTTFIVTIPFEIASSEETLQIYANGFSKMRALIVDPDESATEYIINLLKHLKMKADVVQDGKSALRQLEKRRGGDYEYTVCILSDQVDDKKVMDTIREIRKENGEKLIILLLTVYNTSEITDLSQEAGVNSVIEKPLFQSSLVDVLMNHFGENMRQKRADIVHVDFSGLHVLLAEDNEMNMEIAEDILSRANLTVDKAVNGVEARDKFLTAEPGTYQAILMDIQMPEMDGFEATQAIRTSKHQEAATIPIIALTANAFNEDVQMALDAGMNGHIAKPINIQELYGILEKVLKK